MRYLALGDSYTIGTGGAEGDNFPSQLAARLEAAGSGSVRLTNLGVNGFTSADLLRHELSAAAAAKPAIVTCLIGVNDYVQGVPLDMYRERLSQIYTGIGALGLGDGRAVAISIPDFSFTPAARQFGDPGAIAEGLKAFNDVGAAEAAGAGLSFIDIFETSRAGAGTGAGWPATGCIPAGPSTRPGSRLYGAIWALPGASRLPFKGMVAGKGTIHSINISVGGVPKLPVAEAQVGELGIVGDGHNDRVSHGGPERALCLYSLERLAALQAEGHPILPGAMGENITMAGIDSGAFGPGRPPWPRARGRG